MDHGTLAQRFDDATDSLTAGGQAVIVRKARDLLVGGDVDGVVEFLRNASRRSALPELDNLAGAVESWKGAGGSAGALAGDGAWNRSAARSRAVAERIANLTDGADLSNLIHRLVLVQKGEADAEVPAVLAPTTPSVDEMVAGGPQTIGSIFGERAEANAVVEASQLVSKPLVIEETRTTSAPPLALAPESEAPPAPPPISIPVPMAPDALQGEPTMVQSSLPFEDDVQMIESTPPQPVSGPPAPPEAALAPPPPPPVSAQQASKPVSAAPPAAVKPAADLPPPPPPAEEVEVSAPQVTPPRAVEGEPEAGAALWIGMAVLIIVMVLIVFFTR